MMDDRECAEMEAAAESYTNQTHSFVQHIWNAARKYEPPAPKRCGECAHAEPVGGHGRGCSRFVEPIDATTHEREAMSAFWLRYENEFDWDENDRVRDVAFAFWKAARAYEPPAVCGALRNANNVCALTEGHDGDHRAPLHLGGYFGWPRDQEPDPDERCSECAARRKSHHIFAHAFVSAKEAAK